MTIRSGRSIAFAVALAGVSLCGGAWAAAPGQGQPRAASPALSRAAPLQSREAGANYSAAPTVRLFGMPAAVWAPVDPPYAGAAFRTLAGQAETSADVVAEQGTPWH